VAELIALKVDILVLDGTRAGLAAKSATSTIPIVLAIAGDPLGTGLVGSLARPDGNITGMTLMAPELAAKRMALLKEMVPKAARVAVLMNPEGAHSRLHWRDVQIAAPKLRITVQAVEVRRPTDLGNAFSTVVGWHRSRLARRCALCD
jgi:putative ABC transport system substrate-binding protein